MRRLDTEQQSYKKFFLQSWLELENQYRKGNIDPQHENDVVCYLYHALAKKFAQKRFPLYFIKTEDTRNLKNGSLRPDLNLNDRLFIEVKLYHLRDYRQGWKRRQEVIEYTVDKLKQYVAYQKSISGVHVREPILAVWFRKRKLAGNTNSGDKYFLNDDLIKKLAAERDRYKGSATILFGPTNPK